MSHPQDLPLRDQAAAVAAGALDAAELLEQTLTRIEERDGELNSIVATFPEESERMLAEAPPGPIHGLPVAVKDMYQLPWRGPRDGSAHEQMPPAESALFQRIRDAGGVVVGVTNTHFWGAGTTGASSAYGPVATPWNLKHCGGGSSGGSAASVGGRLVGAALAADGLGSIRVPAAYCGVTGLKATFGALSHDGYTHPYASMDASGPIGRDAADARLFGEVLAGAPLPAADGSGLTVAMVESPFWDDLDGEVETACRAALEAAGWKQRELALELAEHAVTAGILTITMDSAPSNHMDELADADAVMRALVKYQHVIPAHLLSRAWRVRAHLRREVARAFERVDLLAWPTTQAPSPPIENPTVTLPSGDVPADAANFRGAAIGNLCGTPAISVPVGTSSSGVPIGLQLTAAWGRDSVLLDAAEHLENATDREHVDAVPPMVAGAAA